MYLCILDNRHSHCGLNSVSVFYMIPSVCHQPFSYKYNYKLYTTTYIINTFDDEKFQVHLVQ